MAAGSIRLLLAEDNADDAELELRELRRAGLRVASKIVDSRSAFMQALGEFDPQVIISDFSMPNFDGMEALRLATELAPDTPFLFVSSTLGEDYAIRALKNGATDYVLKSNLVRLPAAIERALTGAEERRARRQAEAGLRRAQVMAKLASVVTGPGGAFERWSESLPGLLAVDRRHVPASTREWLDILHPEDRDLFRQKSLEADATRQRVDVDYRLRRGDGEWIHIRQVIEPLSASEEGPFEGRWFSTLQDVSEQKQAEIQIKRLNRVYAVLSGINTLIVRARDRDELFGEACRIAVEHGKFPLAWIGLLDKDKARVSVMASAGAADGYLELMPMQVSDDPQGQGMAGLAVKERRAMIANDIASDPRIVTKAQALEREFRSLVLLPLVVSGESVGVLALYAEQKGFFDEQEMRLLNELAGDVSFAIGNIEKDRKLEYLSYFDALTGLANRTLFMDRLAQSVAATREQHVLALAVIDVARFKTINDSLGRHAGDAVLTQIGQRLAALAGDASHVARISADHFAVIIPNARDDAQIARVIEAGYADVEGRPFVVAGSELRLAIRTGISLYPNDGADAEAVFRNAESALKKAKASAERYLFYTQAMTARVSGMLALENKLRRAIEREEFVLHYQPKVDLEQRRLVGVEALIRWQSPEGLVPPVQFVPLLEETGLINPVGFWVMKQALRDHHLWSKQGLKAPRVAVNVSAVQLRQRDFVALVQEVLAQGASPTPLDLEITESMLMDDLQGNIDKLNAMRALGVDIAIDDFGTGYSSLGYLARLPVQQLKVDRSFIISMDKDPNAMTLVSTMLSLAHALGLKVVAEGVETESQANTLRLLRCDVIQGYLISKPVPMAGISALLQPRA
ncbi:MAG: EAL domain-containing protein [Burkholderiales bacterium]